MSLSLPSPYGAVTVRNIPDQPRWHGFGSIQYMRTNPLQSARLVCELATYQSHAAAQNPAELGEWLAAVLQQWANAVRVAGERRVEVGSDEPPAAVPVGSIPPWAVAE